MSRLQQQSRFDQSDDVVVMKFGGTSVEDAAAIRRLIRIVESRLDAQPVIVVSALAGVTDQLLDAGHAAVGGGLGAALDKVREIYVRHEKLADELLEGPAHSTLAGELRCEFRSEFQSLESLLHELDAWRKLSIQSWDRLLGFGECLSSKLIATALREAGVGSVHVDARTCILTDSSEGQTSPLWDETNERLQRTLVPLLESGRVPVLGGFIASASDGTPTTLGRGGSDFTAAIVGAALSATRVEIWKTVDGVMTADPKLCPEARVIRKISFDEAAELARFGAKVLHPKTLTPLTRENIPVYVLNSRRPGAEGTEITARARPGDAVRAITVKRNVVAVEIERRDAVDLDLPRAVHPVVDQHGSPVDLIATTLDLILSFVDSPSAVTQETANLSCCVARPRWKDNEALVCLVGENIRQHPEVARLVLAATSDLEISFCQTASDRTISFLVEESNLEESLRRLHRVFFPKPEIARDWGESRPRIAKPAKWDPQAVQLPILAAIDAAFPRGIESGAGSMRCSPHSVLANPGQRPARGSSPGPTARVQ
jgi:aspartate kinase